MSPMRLMHWPLQLLSTCIHMLFTHCTPKDGSTLSESTLYIDQSSFNSLHTHSSCDSFRPCTYQQEMGLCDHSCTPSHVVGLFPSGQVMYAQQYIKPSCTCVFPHSPYICTQQYGICPLNLLSGFKGHMCTCDIMYAL